MATSTVKRQIDILDEQWKANHLEALSCWEFEDLLRLCIETFERIGRQDEGWRNAVFGGERPYSAEEERGFALYTPPGETSARTSSARSGILKSGTIGSSALSNFAHASARPRGF